MAEAYEISYTIGKEYNIEFLLVIEISLGDMGPVKKTFSSVNHNKKRPMGVRSVMRKIDDLN